MKSVVEFDQVSKRFTLKGEQRSLRDSLRGLFRPRREGQAFWALRDVSFDVGEGESFGLIGHNGSGKSTSLKLITRILEPTSGRVAVRGRIAALLELGSGFHPDLSGRENVFLNGALLGFSRRDMQHKMDAIVEFAELEQFIDTPVKHYSSGMFARLGFAIATAVDPDILITDEVLAVGDEAFQRKCMERIFEFRRDGKTIIFVSHALDVVRTLCQRAVWLDHGELRAFGDSNSVINSYLQATNLRELERAKRASHTDDVAEADEVPDANRWGSREAELVSVELCDANGSPQQLFTTGGTLIVRMHYRATTLVRDPQVGLAIYHASGAHVCGPNNTHSNFAIPLLDGRGVIEWRIDDLPLLQGEYLLSTAIYDTSGMHPYDHRHQAFRFAVRSAVMGEGYGLVRLHGTWRKHP
jgi:ABC-type polysaccharide/polyol phosphate transport system ATPase subunit